jgi:glycosyltransferase involved in cell wall biosynthesis
MKIAFIGALAPSSVLPNEFIRERSRGITHPTPWVSALLPELARSGHYHLRMIMVDFSIKRHVFIEKDGVEYEGIPSLLPERLNRKLLLYQKSLPTCAAIKRFQPHLVHAFGFETGSASIALRSGFPVSCFIQGISEKIDPYNQQRDWLERKVALWCERTAVSRVRWMVAENEFARNWALSHNPSADIEVIPHTLRSQFLDKACPNFAPNFVFVGTLSYNKGIDTCLQALAKTHHPHATLTIIGSGPYREELEKLVSCLGLAHRVHFLGPLHTSDVIRELNQSTCLLLASRMDTSPNVLTEAHAIGLPVIGTRVGGIPEMIDHEVDGFLVDGNDASAMASYMNHILDDPQKACQMGAMGRKKVQTLNDPARIADASRNFFSRVLAEAAKTPR